MKPRYTLGKFLREFWYITILGPLFFTAVISSLTLLGIDAGKPWAIMIAATVTGCAMLAGGWIRNQWLLSSGKWKTDTTKYERDGSVHTLEVMDKEGPLRDRWGNRLFTEKQMLAFCNSESVPFPCLKEDLDAWVKANKIP